MGQTSHIEVSYWISRWIKQVDSPTGVGSRAAEEEQQAESSCLTLQVGSKETAHSNSTAPPPTTT